MALTQEEIDFISSVTEYDENIGYHIYHITGGTKNDKHNYLAHNPFTDYVNMTRVDRSVGDRSEKHYLIILTDSPDSPPTLPDDASRIVEGLGD